MHSKYQNININKYKAQIKEVGDIARQNRNMKLFQLCAAEWKIATEYEKSLIAPWD